MNLQKKEASTRGAGLTFLQKKPTMLDTIINLLKCGSSQTVESD